MSMLLSIISSEWRRALAPETDVQRVEAIDVSPKTRFLV